MSSKDNIKSETAPKKRILKDISYKDLLNFIPLSIEIAFTILKSQVSLSLNEFNSLIFILGGCFFLLTFYLIFYYVKSLMGSLINNRSIKADLIRFFLNLLTMEIILYLLINRIYYYVNYIYLLLIYIPTLTILFLIIIYFIRKKTNFGKLKPLWKKSIIIIVIFITFYSPFLLGAELPRRNPRVNLSPKPQEISYEKGNQIQKIQEVTVSFKSVEGNARNIKINIQVPPNFYYWVDGIQINTKIINFLKYDEIYQFTLEIQPSISVGNGSYTIEIHWSYESDLGNVYNKSIKILIIIGPIENHLYLFLGVYGGIIAMIIALIVTFLLVRKRKNIQ